VQRLALHGSLLLLLLLLLLLPLMVAGGWRAWAAGGACLPGLVRACAPQGGRRSLVYTRSNAADAPRSACVCVSRIGAGGK
jgi:hypothetical protein